MKLTIEEPPGLVVCYLLIILALILLTTVSSCTLPSEQRASVARHTVRILAKAAVIKTAQANPEIAKAAQAGQSLLAAKAFDVFDRFAWIKDNVTDPAERELLLELVLGYRTLASESAVPDLLTDIIQAAAQVGGGQK